jgi:ABC-type sugar transport system permease subunit
MLATLGNRTVFRIKCWFFVLPVVLGTLIFNIAPILPTIYLSLTDWSGGIPGSFVGFYNYRELATNPEYWATLWRTVVFMFGTVGGGYAVSLILAMLVDGSFFGHRFFRVTFFAPVVTSSVAVGMTWRWILNTDFGFINGILTGVGVLGPRWLGNPEWAMFSVIFVTVWRRMGYFMIVFLAGLQGIPESLYEAADLDGATPIQKFTKITFPLLSPISFFVIVMLVINAFMAFDVILIMTRGGPGTATAVYVYRLWHEGFGLLKMGYASAMAWVLFIIVGGITIFQWIMSKKWVFYR